MSEAEPTSDVETARAIHRVVRALHAGECPRCHGLFDNRRVSVYYSAPVRESCPGCGFTVTAEEQRAALRAFGPVMARDLEVFERWRSKALNELATEAE